MNYLLTLCVFFIFQGHKVNCNTYVKNKDGYSILSAGWYLWDPYQYKELKNGLNVLTGLDVKLSRAILKQIDHKTAYQNIPWSQHQTLLKNGKIDFAAGATFTKERAQYAYFSKPYRFEENSLFVLRKNQKALEFNNISEFLQVIKKNNFKLAIIDGFIYANDKINQWIADPVNAALIVRVNNDAESVTALLTGQVDGFLADRVVGSTTIWRRKLTDKIAEIRLRIRAPIHLMFSKQRTEKAFINQINQAIDGVKKSQIYNTIIRSYLYPVLLLNTVSESWFLMLEIWGIIAFAVSGIIIAHRQRSTFFGAIVLATVPAIGGGIIRDVIFDREPVGALKSPLYFSLVILTVIIGFFFVRIKDFYLRHKKDVTANNEQAINKLSNVLFVISEAMGLAAFSISGVIISIVSKAEPLWLFGPFFATITGAGGGIIRDLLSLQNRIGSLGRDIYAEIAVIWGAFLSVFLVYQSTSVEADPIKYSVIITTLGVFITRILCYFIKIPNLYFRKPVDKF